MGAWQTAGLQLIAGGMQQSAWQSARVGRWLVEAVCVELRASHTAPGRPCDMIHVAAPALTATRHIKGSEASPSTGTQTHARPDEPHPTPPSPAASCLGLAALLRVLAEQRIIVIQLLVVFIIAPQLCIQLV